MSDGNNAKQISRRVLCVDDERPFLEGLKRRLRRKFDLTIAVGPEEGLKVLKAEGSFAVVIVDYMMPNMNGVEFLRAARQYAPDAVTVMLTGRTDLDVAVGALHEGRIYRFLNKPCPAEVLESTINDCLEQHRLVLAERILTGELNAANEELRSLNEDLEQRVAARTATITGLYEFVAALSGLDSVETVAELVVSVTAKQLHSRRVSLMMPDSSGEYLKIVAGTGMPPEVIASARAPIGASVAGHAFAEASEIVINDASSVSDNQRYSADSFMNIPLMSVSLSAAGRCLGVINVTERITEGFYDEYSLVTLRTIAEASAVAIQNQIRLRERNEARDGTIFALAKLAEYRDPDTGAHLERVQEYCRLICESLAEVPEYSGIVDRVFIDTIVRSSPLHDIGKVGIPDRILLKPGRLTAEEFEVMKRHAAIGGDTIRTVIRDGREQSFLQMGMEIAYFHHEKFDGSGYPHGIAGDTIPLPARIMTVADVYDALTSQRVYKAAMPHEKAASIIRADSGTHFDPVMVAAFNDREQQFRSLALELADRPARADQLAVDAAEPLLSP